MLGAQNIICQNKLGELKNANEPFINFTDQVEGTGTTEDERVANSSTWEGVMQEIS